MYHEYKVDYICNFFTEKRKLYDFLKRSPCAVLISTTFLNVKRLVEIIDYVEAVASKTPIIAGGQLVDYLSHFQPYIFEFNRKKFRNILFIWDAQGEKTLLSLLHAIDKKISYESIPNLIYYKNQQVIKNEKIEETQPIDHYIIQWDSIDGKYLRHYVPVKTSAGCPFQCTFCTFAKLHRKIKLKPVESLEKELKLISRKNIKHVMFVDDLVAISKKRLMEITDMIIKNNFNFTWSALLRSDSITDRSMVKKLKQSGLVLASLGIESFDQTVLNNMKKRTTPQKHFNAVKMLKHEKIFVNGFFVFGYPGETENSIEKTIEGIIQSEVDLCEVHLWNNVPGAPISGSREFNLKGGYSVWSHNTMNSVEAMTHITKLFKRIPLQFGMTDDNVLPLVLLLANGYSNTQIKKIYAVKSNLVINRGKYLECNRSLNDFQARQSELLKELRSCIDD